MPNPRYRVRIAPASHQLEVELTVSGLSPGTVRFELPTWVPGAYGFMKYARDLFDLKAFDLASGEALPLTRDGWSGFKVERAQGGVKLQYTASASDHSFGELSGLVEH